MADTETMTVDELVEEFEFLGDWDAQCDFLIDLGFELPKLPDEAKTEQNRVHGCQSNVWMIADVEPTDPPKFNFIANSDAMIVSGLIAVLRAIYAEKTPQQVVETDPRPTFERLGLDRHLSPARRNGLGGMIERLRSIAATHS